jgi:membrane-associated protease RseP (regulator of RpoE activity)
MSYRSWLFMALVVSAAKGVAAQERAVVLPSCGGDQPVLGDLGYSGLSCNCTHFFDGHDPAAAVWRFRSEPRIEGVKRGGPADGKLRRGDLIVAIDGVLITSDEGGRRFAQVQPGQPVALTVRRGGRQIDVEITPDPECPAEVATPTPRAAPAAPPPPAPVAQPTPPADPVPTQAPAARVPTPPPPAKLASRGWLGFSLSCSRCGWSQGRDQTVTWEFSEPPTIDQVEPDGPAALAGLRDGDRITHIDGLDITTAEGGARFGAIDSGQHLTFRVERSAGQAVIEFTAGDRAEKLAQALRQTTTTLRATPTPDRERFTGTIGNTAVQVTGGAVSVTQTDDEIVIRSADITVRIRRTDAGR